MRRRADGPNREGASRLRRGAQVQAEVEMKMRMEMKLELELGLASNKWKERY